MEISTKRDLPCKFTDEEFQMKTQELLKLHAELSETEAEFAVVKTKFSGIIKKTEGAMDTIFDALKAGGETRPIECDWEYDWVGNVKALRRRDTGDIVETAAITDGDRQEQLDIQQEQELQKLERQFDEGAGDGEN